MLCTIFFLETRFYPESEQNNFDCDFENGSSCSMEDKWIKNTGFSNSFNITGYFNPIITDERWEGR